METQFRAPYFPEPETTYPFVSPVGGPDGAISLLILSISKLSEGVSGLPAIACKYIQVSIKSEEQLSTIVVRSWFIDLQDNSGKEIIE